MRHKEFIMKLKTAVIIGLILGILFASIISDETWDKIDSFSIFEEESLTETWQHSLSDNVPGWNMMEIMAFKELRLDLYDIGVKNRYHYVEYDSSISIEYNIMYHSQLTIDKVDSIWNVYNDEKMGLKLRRSIRYYAEEDEAIQTKTF